MPNNLRVIGFLIFQVTRNRNPANFKNKDDVLANISKFSHALQHGFTDKHQLKSEDFNWD